MLLNVPAGHKRQLDTEDAISASLNVPGTHKSHVIEATFAAYDPCEHAQHDPLPEIATNIPMGHDVHIHDPEVLLNVPGGHSSQPVEPADALN